jgi:hypothetical protein
LGVSVLDTAGCRCDRARLPEGCFMHLGGNLKVAVRVFDSERAPKECVFSSVVRGSLEEI